ncbi:S24/S26 family peptidase [Hoeflea sp.]|uniref:S24/S26 family peptidase n=1 Tax=Hoeflea sp. TaxID=1940281 RepID=UPI003B0214CE
MTYRTGMSRIGSDRVGNDGCIGARQAAVAALAVVLLMALRGVNAAGLVIGNPTASVPRGLYRAAAQDSADHVSFCLRRVHRDEARYARFCSPDNPDGLRILKRIERRAADGTLIVAGDADNALDSRLVGPVRESQVRGWWKSLIRVGTF